MSETNWSSLTESVRTVLSDVKLSKAQVEKVMDGLTARKAEVLKGLKPAVVRERRKRDPNAPKKNMTNYLFFCNEHRPTVKASNPDLKAVDLTAKLAKMWREIPEKDKKKYNQLAEADKARYEQERESYVPSASDVGEKKKKVKSDKPRKISGYALFSEEVRAKLKQEASEIAPTAVFREISDRWKRLNEKEQAVYGAKAQARNEANGTASAVSAPSVAPAKATKATPASTAGGRGKKSAETPGFLAFSKEKREELSHMKKKAEQTAEIARQWADLDDEDREAYEEAEAQ